MSNQQHNWIPELPSKTLEFSACCHLENNLNEFSDLPKYAVGIFRKSDDLFVRLRFDKDEKRVHYHFNFATSECFSDAPDENSSLDQMNEFVQRFAPLPTGASMISTFNLNMESIPAKHIISLLSEPSESPAMRMSEAKFSFENGPVESLKWIRDGSFVKVYVESVVRGSIADGLFENEIQAHLEFLNEFVER